MMWCWSGSSGFLLTCAQYGASRRHGRGRKWTLVHLINIFRIKHEALALCARPALCLPP